MTAHFRVDMTATEISKALDRTCRSIYMQARKQGLSHELVFLSDELVIERIEALHPQGYSDYEITAELETESGVSLERHRVGRLRNRLGLASNKCHARQKKRAGETTRRLCNAAGFDSLGAVRSKVYRDWVGSLGWPDHLTVRAAQAAELFYRRGPMTRLQLCEAMGMLERGLRDRCEPSSRAKGGTVMAELMRAGLLMCLPRSVPSGKDRRGGVRKVHLYLLNPGVMPSGRAEQRQVDEVGGHDTAIAEPRSDS